MAHRIASAHLLLVCAAFCPEAASAQDKRAAAHAACEADYRQHCASVQPGQGRIIACLEQHIDALSAPCRAIVEQKIANRK